MEEKSGNQKCCSPYQLSRLQSGEKSEENLTHEAYGILHKKVKSSCLRAGQKH